MIQLLLALVFLALASPAYSAEFYAAPNGSGTACTEVAPCSPRQFFSDATKAVGGNTLWLKDGTYTGLDYMLDLSGWGISRSGSPGNPIRVRAVTEGAVLLNGQFARNAIRLGNAVTNAHIDIEGINVCCGGGGTAVITVWGGASSINFRRIVGWDANPNTTENRDPDRVISINNGASNILFEDCAAFGLGQAPARVAFSTNNTTFRRCWFRWEGAFGASGPANMGTIYRSGSTNHTLENVVMTWTGHRQVATPINGAESFITSTNDPGTVTVTKVLGTILYAKSGASFLPPRQLLTGFGASTILLQDIVALVQPTQSLRPFETVNCTPGGTSPCSHTANRLTGIRGTNSSIFSSDWAQTNVNEYTSVSAANAAGKNIFTTTTGAQVCKRYVDGAITATPLWPWPMDGRIKAALSTAGTQALAGPDQTVTSEIESIFGPIPSQCRAGEEPPPPPPPPPTPSLVVTPSSLAFSGAVGSAISPQSILIENVVPDTSMPWTASDDAGWLVVAPSSGTNTTLGTASVNTAGLAPGTYFGAITVSAPGATGTPRVIGVTLTILPTTSPAHRVGGKHRR